LSSPIRPTWTSRPFTTESSLHGSSPLVLVLRTAGFLKFLFIFAKWISVVFCFLDFGFVVGCGGVVVLLMMMMVLAVMRDEREKLRCERERS
jgi:hypothetical protein